MIGALRRRVTRSSSWRSVQPRFFLIKRILLVCFLLGLDVRDLVYKVVWQGPADSYSFETGSAGYLETQPVKSLVTQEMRDQGAVASGWSSFLSRCEVFHPFVSPGSKFFLAAQLRNCRVPINGTVSVIPRIVGISSARVDSMARSACRLLFHARRPRVCGDAMVVHFNERYEFNDVAVGRSAMATIGSHAETELLRLLDLIGLSYPLHKIVCVEGFTMRDDRDHRVFSPHVFACSSPNLNRVEFVGFDAHGFKHLQTNKAWLTEDVLAFLGWRFGIRQNCKSNYEIADEPGITATTTTTSDERKEPSTLSIRTITKANFSSHGLLYGLVILIDVVLLSTHLRSIAKLLQWMRLRPYFQLQLWIRRFDDDHDDRYTSAPVLPGDREPSADGFDERALYAFFTTSYYRSWRYRVLIVATRLLSWVIIMPNAVIWTWSDSKNMKFQAYLCSIKSWVLVAATFTWGWRAFVRLREPLAYHMASMTHITNQEIIAIASLAAFVQRNYIFTICETKWQFERQRVNDITSFQGGYVAHGNTYDPTSEHNTTPLRIAWIIYAPLVRIIGLSVMMIGGWLTVKLAVATVLRVIHRSSTRRHALTAEPYKRLPLEDALASPIRALSIVRFQRSMEMVKGNQRFIRPSCYLDYGIMLKTVEYKRVVHLHDMFQVRKTVGEIHTVKSNTHIHIHPQRPRSLSVARARDDPR